MANLNSARKVVNDIKEQFPCADCGEYFPYYCMDFDHVNNHKTGNVSDLLRYKGLQAALDEIYSGNVELVCANCHRKRTYLRKINEKRLKN